MFSLLSIYSSQGGSPPTTTACVIGAAYSGPGSVRATSRVRWLTPELVKGREFDLVILVDPESFGAGIEGAVDRYVAVTRATRQLVILTTAGLSLSKQKRAPAEATRQHQASAVLSSRDDHQGPVTIGPDVFTA